MTTGAPRGALIARGMEEAARSVVKALLDDRLADHRSDPIYVHLHAALNHMAAVRMLVDLDDDVFVGTR